MLTPFSIGWGLGQTAASEPPQGWDDASHLLKPDPVEPEPQEDEDAAAPRGRPPPAPAAFSSDGLSPGIGGLLLWAGSGGGAAMD